MNTLEKLDQRKNIFLLLFAFVFCAAFIDRNNPNIRISVYYLYEVVLFLACIAAGLYVLIAKKIILLKHWIMIPFFLIIVWSLTEMLLFDGLKFAPKFFIYALVEMFIFINIVINFTDQEKYNTLIKYTCWVFMGLAFLLTLYYFSRGKFINFNSGQSYTKYLLGFGALCSYYLMLTERKVIYGVLTYALLILCMLSLVRKMWLALFITCIVITVIYLAAARKTMDTKAYRKSVYMILALLLAILVAAGALLLFVPKMTERVVQSLGSINLAETSMSDMSRRLLNQAAIEKIKESPIIGNGWGDRLYIEEMDVSLMIHNCYLSVICQLGLIGFVLYYGVFTYSLAKSILIMKKKEYFYEGLFILAMWLFAAIVLYYRPLNRMSYYLWGPPVIFALIFEAWAYKKVLPFKWCSTMIKK